MGTLKSIVKWVVIALLLWGLAAVFRLVDTTPADAGRTIASFFANAADLIRGAVDELSNWRRNRS